MLDEVGSYSRQIGRIADALEGLVRHPRPQQPELRPAGHRRRLRNPAEGGQGREGRRWAGAAAVARGAGTAAQKWDVGAGVRQVAGLLAVDFAPGADVGSAAETGNSSPRLGSQAASGDLAARQRRAQVLCEIQDDLRSAFTTRAVGGIASARLGIQE